MTRVLVTGATGFIGKTLVSYLLNKSFLVRVLVRKKVNFFSNEVEQHEGDLCISSSLAGVCKDIDIVFHLAGHAHAWQEKNILEEERHQQINFFGTEAILNEAIVEKVKKFIFFSTIKAVAESIHCIDETWDVLPESAYGKAKRAAETQVLLMGKKHNLSVCVLRLSLVYGAELKGNLYQMLRAIDKGYFLPIPKVKNKRSLISVYDVCEAAYLVSQREEANGKIYFLTDKMKYSTYFLYEKMCYALGRSVPRLVIPFLVFKLLAKMGDVGQLFLRRRLPFNTEALSKLFGSSDYDSSRIQNELGFEPKYTFQQLLPEMVKSYRDTQK